MDTRHSPWKLVLAYIIGVGTLLLAGYAWVGLRWDPTNLAMLLVIAWVLWLHSDRANILDYAAQAADDADSAARSFDTLTERVDELAARIDDRDAETQPVIPQPRTEPMARAWDISARELMEDNTQTINAVPRTIDGHTFRFRTPDGD